MDPKIIAAMELLNAAAKEKKEDVRSLISGKYNHLKEALAETPNLVKENPWWLVGGVAVSLLAAGIVFLFTRKR